MRDQVSLGILRTLTRGSYQGLQISLNNLVVWPSLRVRRGERTRTPRTPLCLHSARGGAALRLPGEATDISKSALRFPPLPSYNKTQSN